jgi:hypothetical protein
VKAGLNSLYVVDKPNWFDILAGNQEHMLKSALLRVVSFELLQAYWAVICEDSS